MRTASKKTLSLALAAVLALGSVTAGMPLTAQAVGMQESTPVITPNIGISSGTVVGFAGQEWWVIGDVGSGVSAPSGHITLLAKSTGTPYGSVAFRTGSETRDDPNWTQYSGNGWYYEGTFNQPGNYADSTLHRKMEDIANGFSSNERALIAPRTLTAEDDSNYPITGGNVSNQKLWPLSGDEVNTINNNTVCSYGNYWWLRSAGQPSSTGFDAGVAFENGDYLGYGIYFGYGDVHNSIFAIRPAFYLNLASVLFTSDASGAAAKSTATVGSGLIGTSAPGSNLKFTMVDDEQNLDIFGLTGGTGSNSLILAYDPDTATTGTHQYISCVLMDGNDVKYYGKLENLGSTASGTVSVPLTNVDNGIYTLKLFVEQANDNLYTDFASEPFEMEIEVDSSGNGTPTDTDKPTVSGVTPNEANVSIATNTLSIEFNEEMNTAPSIGTVALDNGASVTNGVWQSDKKTIDYNLSGLAYDTQYTVNISGFQDAAGNGIATNNSKTFATVKSSEKDITAFTIPNQVGGTTIGSDTVFITMPYGTALSALTPSITVSEYASVSPASGAQQDFTNPVTYTVTAQDASTKDYTVTVTNAAPDAHGITLTAEPAVGGNPSASETSATDGTQITLAANPNSGYSFTGWTVVSPNTLTLSNDSAPAATFTMPNEAVEIKAAYRYVGSGSHSDSDSSDSSSTTTVTIPPTAQPNHPTVGSVSGQTAGTTTQRTFTVTESLIKAALEKAQAEAKKQDRTAYGVGAQIELDTPTTAGLTLTLERAALNRLVSAGAKQFELTGAPISLTFDAQALAELQKQGTGNVTITVKPTTVKGVRNAYDITLATVKDGKTVSITNLGTGSAALSIPSTPGKNEAAGYLYAVYVDGNSKLNRIADSTYDANSGSMLFSTDHFSVYGVGYTAPSAKFTDIGSHWAKESIDYVVGRGLLSGTSDTTFAPDAAMTRGMLVTALGRLAGVDTTEYTANSFTDVEADSAFRPYIEWAYSKGIIQGIGNSQFAPDRAITRQEIAVILQNYAKATGYKLPVTRTAAAFADASGIGSTYKTAVTAMQQAGIMMGGSGNKFNPAANATRAEVSSMLHRYIKLTIDPATAQGWAKNDDGQFLYYKDGKVATGTQTIEGVKYYFNDNGTLKTGWIKDDTGNWHFYSGNLLLVGWWDIGANGNNKRYYFDTYGNMISGKWLQIDGKWYYFNSDGSLAKSTTVDGYEVDENGVRTTK